MYLIVNKRIWCASKFSKAKYHSERHSISPMWMKFAFFLANHHPISYHWNCRLLKLCVITNKPAILANGSQKRNTNQPLMMRYFQKNNRYWRKQFDITTFLIYTSMFATKYMLITSVFIHCFFQFKTEFLSTTNKYGQIDSNLIIKDSNRTISKVLSFFRMQTLP